MYTPLRLEKKPVYMRVHGVYIGFSENVHTL